MITVEEWAGLHVGDSIHCVIQSASTVYTRTITDIRDAPEKTVQVTTGGYFLDYAYFNYDYFFLNKQDALNHLITNLNTEINKLNLALENAKNQLVKENDE